MSKNRGAASVGLGVALKNWIVEPLPAEPTEIPVSSRVARPVIAVAGLNRRSGATTVARALGTSLALRDPEGAALVSAESAATTGIPLGTLAALRLARAAERALPLRARPTGRLCLVEVDGEAALVEAAGSLAPLVLDVWDPSRLSIAASLADAVVLVAVPESEPALARVLTGSVVTVGPEPIVALNRDVGGTQERWAGRVATRIPEARFAARLAAVGREAPSGFGRAVDALTDLVLETL